jgi:hypothetical protein
MAASKGEQAMTDIEINEAIALQLGWAKCACGDIRCGVWFPHGTSHPTEAELGVPSFCKDLNAMAEAEQFLDSTNGGITDPNCLRYAYSSEVYRIVPDTVQPFRASARQRAEAFLRTVGKWKEARP